MSRSPRRHGPPAGILLLAGIVLPAGLVAASLSAAPRVRAADAQAAAGQPGFVAGADKPQVDGPVVAVDGGWMVPYDDTIPGTKVVFRMIPVPGGVLRMGSPDGEDGREASEGPRYEVRIDPYWIGRCEVTWAEYRTYMAACDLFKAMEQARVRPITPLNEADAVTAPSNLYDPTTTFSKGEDPRQPAVTMTQFAARQYTKWLSGLTGRFYRLPTEGEWEYACRAGTDTPWNTGTDAAGLDAAAWFADNADDTTHPVGGKAANAWGLHDMHGNVAEWVLDELVPEGYARQAALPQPVPGAVAVVWPQHLSPRVVRGGAFYDEADRCRSAARRGSEDLAWKEIDPNLPKSPWWYTEEPALGVGMRLVRPLAPPDRGERLRWGDADIESIRADASDRLMQGRGSRGIVDPQLPEELKAKGIGN